MTTKLDALITLEHAYLHIKHNSPVSKHGASLGDSNALYILEDKFHVVRRSMQSVEDSNYYEEEANEGFNGKMPAYF